MHSIYAGAAFVIAAAAAIDSSQGFLADQMPHATSTCFLDGMFTRTSTSTSTRNVFSSSAIVALPCQKFAAAEHELSLSRLKSRGWVYQEEELAARVLYFCDHQLVLRCNRCHRTVVQQYVPPATVQRVPNTIWARVVPISSLVKSILLALRGVIPWRGKDARSNDEIDAHDTAICISRHLSSIEGQRTWTEGATLPSTQQERWWTLVEEYSSRYLSYGADKLPAIQGLADRFQFELLASQDFETHTEPMRYLSGLWSGDALAMGLLWYVKDGITIRPDSRAPSWSWAAVDGVIGHNSLHGHAHEDMCGVSVLKVPDSLDHTLVLRAMVKSATWHRAPNDQKMYYIGHRRQGAVRFQHDLAQYEPLTIDLTQGPEVQLLRDLSGRDVGHLILDSESELANEGSEVYCLRIVVKPATRKEEHDFNVPWATRGLALRRDPEDSRKFRRIGYIELQRTPGGISYQSSLNPTKQKAERNPPPNIDVAEFFDDCEFTTISVI